jgi:hypothetical protein
MSFLRHGEIYPCDEGTISRPCPPLIAVDESPAGYSWQVALQQSPASASPAGAILPIINRARQRFGSERRNVT